MKLDPAAGAALELSDYTASARGVTGIAVVIPCYRERSQILAVMAVVPDIIERIYVVDDGCPQNTGAYVEQHNADPRVQVLYHGKNQGVGAAMRSGYRAALAQRMQLIVKLDGDGQMDPAEIARLIAPIQRDQADYTKGNRFYRLDGLTAMPLVRLAGNIVLSFVSKLSTGYWQLFDPNNGFTAIDARVLEMIPLDDVDAGYFFESDMLFRLNTLRAVVQDVPMRARYGDEKSSVRLPQASLLFAVRHTMNFFKRLFYNYFLRGFSVASVEWVVGPLALGFGLVFGLGQWLGSIESGVAATAGTVMLASLPTIVGMQMLLSAIHFDIGSEPVVPLCRLLGESPQPSTVGDAADCQ
jgi:dolichol-phosphate mannosyltransferase